MKLPSVFLFFLLALCHAAAFVPMKSTKHLQLPSKLHSNSGDDGYSLIGTLSRQGPIPAFVRLTQPEKYDQAITKFMLTEKCSRTEAQASMDAYFNDPIGWQLARKEFERSGYKPDYVNASQSPVQLFLTLVWGVISTFFIWRIYAYTQLGIDYKDNLLGF